MNEAVWRGTMPPFFDHPDRACAGADTDLFFPETGGASASAAIAICDTCPLVDMCAEWAIPQILLHGVWGGLTRQDRQNLRLGRPIARQVAA